MSLTTRPGRQAAKAISFPSGDHAGSSSVPAAGVDDPRAVGRPARVVVPRADARERALLRAVRVHHPDLGAEDLEADEREPLAVGRPRRAPVDAPAAGE